MAAANPGMTDAKTLHDEDFVAWSKEQAEALRAARHDGSNQNLDWENLAEEVESLGISERRELHSQIQRIIRHLLKLQFSLALEPRRRWVEPVEDARSEIEIVLRMSPSLKPEVAPAIAEESRPAVRRAIADLEKYGELSPAVSRQIRAASFTEEQILGDWFPSEPLA
jgi:hypothetical protein